MYDFFFKQTSQKHNMKICESCKLVKGMIVIIINYTSFFFVTNRLQVTNMPIVCITCLHFGWLILISYANIQFECLLCTQNSNIVLFSLLTINFHVSKHVLCFNYPHALFCTLRLALTDCSGYVHLKPFITFVYNTCGHSYIRT